MSSRLKTIRRDYMVLACQMFSDDQKQMIEDAIKSLATPVDAANLASKSSDYWQYTPSHPFGVLKYRGVDVAIFYKRHVVKIRPSDDGVIESSVARAIGSENDAWIRVSLLDAKSAMKQTQFYAADYERMKTELENARGLNRSLRLENDQLTERILQLESPKKV